MKKFVVVKCPLRVSFFGGGTDFEDYYYKNNSLILSTAINRYIYVTLKKHGNQYNEKFRINYSKVEKQNEINLISNHISRETFKYFKLKKPVSLTILNDIPAGSGLGSSSLFCVSLTKAYFEMFDLKKNKKKHLDIVKNIEIKKLKNPIGIQDYLPGLHGGFNEFHLSKNNIKVKKISNKSSKKLLDNCYLLWTGSFRSASKILEGQKKNIKKNYNYLTEIKKISLLAKKELNKKKISLKKIGKLLTSSWDNKKKLETKIFNNKLEKIEKIIKKSNPYGFKLLGAGGNGFYLILANKSSAKKLYKKFSEKFFFKINLEKNPVKVVYSE